MNEDEPKTEDKQEAPKRESTLKQDLERAYRTMLEEKPNDRSPRDRNYAVLINDMEHLFAYFAAFIGTAG